MKLCRENSYDYILEVEELPSVRNKFNFGIEDHRESAEKVIVTGY